MHGGGAYLYSREASVKPRRSVDERDIAGLITAYRNGTTATFLTTAYGLSLKSVKRIHTAGVRRTLPTRRAMKATPTATRP